MSPRIVAVTGLSGAGRSSVLKALEDAGFDAVDNLPFGLLRPLLHPVEPLPAPLAVGVDARTRDLNPDGLVRQLDVLRSKPGADVTLLFMECDDEVLRRRYTESRRRHPLAGDRSLSDGIARERHLLAPLKEAADLVFDTTATSSTELRRWVLAQFALATGERLTIAVVSFAFRHGLPREADIVFDMRFLQNPYYVEALRPKTGLDPEVQAHVRCDPDFVPTLERLDALIAPLLPRYTAEGKSYLTIGIGCTGGQHRSVVMTEALSERLSSRGWPPMVIHRDMPRGGRNSASLKLVPA